MACHLVLLENSHMQVSQKQPTHQVSCKSLKNCPTYRTKCPAYFLRRHRGHGSKSSPVTLTFDRENMNCRRCILISLCMFTLNLIKTQLAFRALRLATDGQTDGQTNDKTSVTFPKCSQFGTGTQKG